MGDTSLDWLHDIRASFDHHAFEAYHRESLPELIARNGHLVRDDLRRAEPFALQTPDGRAFTYLQTDGVVSIADGADAAKTLIELDETTFSDFVNELLTASGTIQTHRARMIAGALADWQRWEPALRALYSGRPVYGPSAIAKLRDANGRRLDLSRSFGLDDSDDELRAYLLTAGFLHVRSAFSPDEVEQLAAEVELCRANTTPGDGDSWWSVDASGKEVVTRINYLDRFSALLLETAYDPRLARLAKLVNPEMRVCDDRLDGPMVFVKNPTWCRATATSAGTSTTASGVIR